MGTSGGWIGARGGALLLVAAVAGGLLGLHGWSTRHSGPPPGALGRPSSSALGHAAGTSPSAGPSSPGGATPTSPTPRGSTNRPATGPPLSSQSYASYSYLVWPGAPSAAAKSAMTGLSISVHRTGSGISVRAGVNGHPGASHPYPGGARVYVVEASMGDEAGNSDYNLGDDGVVVTDAQGKIVQ
jgi:hypothetical protein